MEQLFIQKVEKYLGCKNFFTAKELVKIGLYGSKSAVWRAVRLKEIECIQISDRRYVILKDSILNHLRKLIDK